MKKLLCVLALLWPALLFAQTYPAPTFSSLTLQTPLTAANGGTGTTTSTGSGSVVLGTSPTLVTPALGTPSALTLTNATGLPLAGLSGLGTGVSTALGNAVTGSGGIALGTSAALTTPVITGGTVDNAAIGSTTPATAAFTTLSTTGNISQTATGNFYAGNGALINRLGDRIFLGGATISDGAFPPVTNDWFSTYQDSLGYTNASPIANLNVSPMNTLKGGTVAGQFAAQSIQSTSAGPSTIGVEAFAINNNTTYADQAWAYYGEAHRVNATVGSVIGMELDTHSLVSNTSSNPYAQGNVIGVQLASGAGVQGNYFTGSITGTVLTVSGGTSLINYQIQVGSIIYGVGVTSGTVVTSLGTGTGGNGTYNINNSQSVSSEFMVATPQYDASAAMQIEANPVKFQSGIVFGATSLTGDDGVTGQANALSLAKGHTLQWYMTGPLPTSSIVSTVSVQADATGINFNNSGMQIFTKAANNPTVAYFTPNSTAVNYLSFSGAVTTASPTILAAGTDTNVNLTLEGQGTGQVTTGTSPFQAPGNDAMTYSNTTAQSIANATQTTVTGWTKVFDRLSANFNASTGTFTAPVTGYYQVGAGLDYSSSAPGAIGEYYRLYVVANAANVCAAANNAQTTTAMDHPVNVNCTVSLSAGQTLVIQALQDSGSAVTLSGAGALNYVSISRVP